MNFGIKYAVILLSEIQRNEIHKRKIRPLTDSVKDELAHIKRLDLQVLAIE